MSSQKTYTISYGDDYGHISGIGYDESCIVGHGLERGDKVPFQAQWIIPSSMKADEIEIVKIRSNKRMVGGGIQFPGWMQDGP
jgi:hypothetical protein